MSLIKKKQIENGFVDQTSQQSVSGQKTFTDQTTFENSTGSHVVLFEGFIYWVSDPKNLDADGNLRQGLVKGRLTTQTYKGGIWS